MSNCSRTSIGRKPLPDGLGLYPDGTNTPPAAYLQAGIDAASLIKSASGPIGFVSIGMSSCNYEFGGLKIVCDADPAKDPRVVLVNGAQPGQSAQVWANPSSPVWPTLRNRITAAGLAPGDVRVLWAYNTDADPTGATWTFVNHLADELTSIIAHATSLLPNLKLVLHATREYAGYSTTALSPEPYAYATGLAVRRMVKSSVANPSRRPWIGWSPYQWADGIASLSGLRWECSEFEGDGTHVNAQGIAKVVGLVLPFLQTSPLCSWYRA